MTGSWSQTATMNVPRELSGITKLPLSGDVLVAGGVTSAGGTCPPGTLAVTTNASAEIYNPATQRWTLTAGSSPMPGAPGGMKANRVAGAELFTIGPDAGMAILAGGVDVETSDGNGVNDFPTCEPLTNIEQTTQTATDLFIEQLPAACTSAGMPYACCTGLGTGPSCGPATSIFTATGALNQDRNGNVSAILNTGPNAGDLVVIGGYCGDGNDLAAEVIGTAAAGGFCDAGNGTGLTDYYELFDPTLLDPTTMRTGSWTVGTATPAVTPAAAPASALLP